MARGRTWLTLLAGVMLLLALTPIQAQEATEEPTGAPISLENAVVTEITEEGVIVNGLLVVIDPDALDFEITVGSVVDLSGVLQSDGQIIVEIFISSGDDDDDDDDDDGGVFVTEEATATAEATEEATATPEVTDEPTVTEEPVATEEPIATEEPAATEEAVDDDDSGVIIIIEGPVEKIEVNIITIFSINIVLDDDDPVLTVIRIGDVIRVEGLLADDDDDQLVSGDFSGGISITIIAIRITFISVEVVIIDGIIWRDSGTCEGAPPDVVIADGGGIEWLIRCSTDSVGDDGSSGSFGYGRGGSGGGGDNDDDDDDDDDGGGGSGGGGGGDNDNDDDD
jgi:hypothetical protein